MEGKKVNVREWAEREKVGIGGCRRAWRAWWEGRGKRRPRGLWGAEFRNSGG